MHYKALIKVSACKLVREALPQLEVFYLGFTRLFIQFAFGLNSPLKKGLHLLFLTSVFVVWGSALQWWCKL